LGVAGACFAQTAPAGHEAQTSSATAGNLITHVTAADGQPIVVTVIDVSKQVMATYQVDRQSGEITLKSVRNITWDLQMRDFNTGKPLPQDIRSGLPK
jgi:hypothetical protein